MSEHTSHNLLRVAAQLTAAAHHVRRGNAAAASEQIAQAMTLLNGLGTCFVGRSQADMEAARRPRGAFAAWQVRRLLGHIDARLTDTVHVMELAALTDLSVSHFCRSFKRTFGLSPHEWIVRRRIEVAQRLMLTTWAPLSEIALACGMSDQSHFTRSFRRIVGDTPFSWRRTRREIPEASTDPQRAPAPSPELVTPARSFGMHTS